MNVLVSVVVVLLLLLAVLLMATGALAVAGRLPGNGLLGVRTPETRRSPAAWRVANAAAGPGFLGAGVATLLGAIALAVLRDWRGLLVLVPLTCAALVLLSTAGLAGARAAAIWQDAQPADVAAGGCCGEASADPVPAADPATDCGVSGGCGSCALSGMCGTERASG